MGLYFEKITKNGSIFCKKFPNMGTFFLTLKWVKAFCTPVSGQGGSLWTLTQKSTFPNEFGGEMQATYKVIQKNQNTAKKSEIGYTITKWRPKKQFLSRDIKFPTKNGKNTFPKEFSLKFGS